MNTNKSLPFIIGAIIIIIAIILVSASNKKTTSIPPSTNTTLQTSTPSSPTTPSSTPSGPSVTTTVPTNPEYTLTQVAIHNNPSNCWTTINGEVYNVTSWISQHPGGAQTIISLCGIDGSTAFNGQHGGEARPASELASFKIGTLKK